MTPKGGILALADLMAVKRIRSFNACLDNLQNSVYDAHLELMEKRDSITAEVVSTTFRVRKVYGRYLIFTDGIGEDAQKEELLIKHTTCIGGVLSNSEKLCLNI